MVHNILVCFSVFPFIVCAFFTTNKIFSPSQCQKLCSHIFSSRNVLYFQFDIWLISQIDIYFHVLHFIGMTSYFGNINIKHICSSCLTYIILISPPPIFSILFFQRDFLKIIFRPFFFFCILFC